MTRLDPIQHLVQRELEWFVECFECECGKREFHTKNELLEPGEPQLGVVEKQFDCDCGKSYTWEYGVVYHV